MDSDREYHGDWGMIWGCIQVDLFHSLAAMLFF